MYMDIKTFLLTGEIYGLNKGITEEDAIQKIGKIFEVEDYGSKGKYLHYDNLRLSISNGELTGMDLYLKNSEESYECNVLGETIAINKNTSLLKMLNILNQLELRWEISYMKSRLDYLQLEISSGVNIFFYFEKEIIESMGIW
jgi:hypothetical protein